jgi:protein SCO1/2
MAVLDPEGRMAGVVQPPFDPAAIAADLAALTGAGSAR